VPIRFWVSPLTDNWDSTANWSLSSGGAGGASVPGSTDTAVFDGNGPGSCLLNTSVSLEALQVASDYLRTLFQTDTITVSGDSTFTGGRFEGNSSSISLNNVYIHGTDFTSTSGVLTIGGSFYFQEEPPIPVPPQTVLDEFTLDAQNISDKFVLLSDLPRDSSLVALNVIGGGPQNYGTDYTVSEFFLSWNGLALDGMLAPGDMIRALYDNQGSMLASTFGHNNGQVVFQASGQRAFMGGARFNDLLIQAASGPLRVDSSCFVERSLNLDGGYLATNLDATIHSWGDMTCNAGFGSAGTGCTIALDGTGRQKILYMGGLLPTILINKQTTEHVWAYGQDPMVIDGDLVIQDGTFNTNGRDLLVGGVSA